ncbi:hypothetical protein AB0I18_51885, partial [Streptomyces sp. NPDC050704]
SGGGICAEAYLPLGTHDFDGVLRRIERSDADGLQIAGRHGQDATVLRAALAFESARPWAHRRPAL